MMKVVLGIVMMLFGVLACLQEIVMIYRLIVWDVYSYFPVLLSPFSYSTEDIATALGYCLPVLFFAVLAFILLKYGYQFVTTRKPKELKDV